MDRSTGTRGGVVALLAISAACFLTQAALGQTKDPSPRAEEAAQLVRRALEAEAQGDADGRREYLRQALVADPDNANAHWQLGEVRVGKSWTSAEKLSTDPVRQRKLDDYHAQLAKSGDKVFDHQKLAQFCAKAGLTEQEQLHLAQILRLSPKSPAAMKKLGVTFVRGRYLTPAQVEADQEMQRLYKATKEQWIPRLVGLKQDADSGDAARHDAALAELRKIRDLDAVPAFEAIVPASSTEFAQAVIRSLAEMPEQSATDSLVRHSVFAPQAEVRQAAMRGLKSRSIYAYAPTLLANLQMPIESRFETFFLEDGRPGHRLTLFQEGETESKEFSSDGVLTGSVTVTVNIPGRMRGNVSDPNLMADAQMAVKAEAQNALQAQMNERVAAALQGTVGEDIPADPKAWWEWWATKNELYSPKEKTVSYISRSTSYAPIQVQYEVQPIYQPVYQAVAYPRARPVNYHSCFVPGTLVWTSGKRTPIEQIKVGEFVLAQNVDTGELAYKPVTATTVGPKLPLVEIHAGAETIQCTVGHLFWVDGTGWQMAKELQAGQWLHTTGGPVLIDSVEKRGEASCHNLIVADFNTYFVTNSALLVHDINVRGPTTAIVPGLATPTPATDPAR